MGLKRTQPSSFQTPFVFLIPATLTERDRALSEHKTEGSSQARWLASAIPALGRLSQEDHYKLKAGLLDHRVRRHLKRKERKGERERRKQHTAPQNTHALLM